MKMTKFKVMLPIALSGLIMANATFAETLDTTKMIEACEMIAKALFDTSDNSDIECLYDVARPASFLKTAAKEIRQGNYPLAVIYMLSAEKNIRFLQLHPEKCPSLASLVKPYIKPVMALKKELEDAVDID
jgi:hypothetical protein